MACDSPSNDQNWYMTFRHKTFGNTLLVFSPDERAPCRPSSPSCPARSLWRPSAASDKSKKLAAAPSSAGKGRGFALKTKEDLECPYSMPRKPRALERAAVEGGVSYLT